MVEEKRIRIALIGLGHIGRIHVAVLQEASCFELVVACDQQPEFSSLVPEGVPFYSSHQELLQHGGFDTAVVATSNSSHYKIALDVLQAGFNVIVEKPATQSLDELDRLERKARETGVHIYYAFHAACAFEVSWLVEHLIVHKETYGPLTGFFSRFYDPYIEVTGNLAPNAESLDNCWIDSGVNALSVLDKVLPVNNLRMGSLRRNGLLKELPIVSSFSVQFDFAVQGGDCSGLGIIETAWDQGVNFKCTELFFGMTGWRLKINHSDQLVAVCSPEGIETPLIVFDGERLVNHYRGLFKDYYFRFTDKNMNSQTARRIHKLFFIPFQIQRRGEG